MRTGAGEPSRTHPLPFPKPLLPPIPAGALPCFWNKCWAPLGSHLPQGTAMFLLPDKVLHVVLHLRATLAAPGSHTFLNMA